MALEADFLTMTSDTITIADPSTASKYGAFTFGSASTGVPCYIEQEEVIFTDPTGVEQRASGTLYVLSTSVTMSPQSKVTLPDGSHPEILRVDILNDEEGQHHLEVLIR